MRCEGEYFFNSFDEAFNFVSAPTRYENEHGIKITDHKILVNMPDTKVTERKTSDGRIMLLIFFKNSIHYDIWKFWIPSSDQMEFLLYVCPIIVQYINKRNEKQSPKKA